MLVPSPAGAGPGSSVEYFLKCEKLRLASPNDPPLPGPANRIPAVLLDVIFKGPTADYLTRLDNGAEVTVTDAVALPSIARNDPVHLVWQPADGQSFLAPAA